MTEDQGPETIHHVGQKDATRIPMEPRTFQAMVEHAPDLVSLHDPGGVYQYASPAAFTLFGYRPEDLEGHNSYEFFHPDDLAAIQQSHDAIMERVETQTVRYRIRDARDEYIWVVTTSRTIRDPHTGEPQQIIAITRRAGDDAPEVAKLTVDPA